jgi:uncharacterized membrane protein
MSVLIRAPVPYLLAGSTLFIAGHNWLSESMSTPLDGWAHFLWVSLYQPGRTIVPLFDYPYFFLFPLLPWLAMMVFGYSLGFLYFRDPVERKKILGAVGSGMILAFLVLRLTGQYGNSDFLWISPTTGGDFQLYEEFGKTFASLLNTEKYPPSLQFTLMTLGPVLLWLAFSSADVAPEDHSRAFRVLILFGRVPLFYYLCHLYLLHVLALIATSVCGQPNEWIQFGADPGSSRPAGYGFGLSVIYFFWLLTITILYFACLWYAKYKREHNYAWLKFM